MIKGGALAAFATVIAALPVLLSFHHTRRAQQDARFFEAIKLLGAHPTSSRLAALTILRDLALEHRFVSVVRDAITDHVRTSVPKESKAPLDMLRALEVLAGLSASERGLDLSGASWRGLDFATHSTLKEFPKCELRDCCFADCILEGIDLTACRCSGADFSGVKLEGCRLPEMMDDCKFIKAVCSGVSFYGRSLNDANFSLAELTKADLRRARLHRAEFEGSTCDDETKFHDAELDGARLHGINGPEPSLLFEGAKNAVLPTVDPVEQTGFIQDELIPDLRA